MDPGDPGPPVDSDPPVDLDPPVDGPASTGSPAPAVALVPGVRESVAGAFDLALGGSGRIRTVSIYCGLLALALVGPAVVLFLGIVRDVGSLGLAVDLAIGPRMSFDPPEPAAVAVLRLVTVAGFLGVFAVLLEGQILVTAALGATASGRKLGLRELLRLSRQVFWPVLGAALLVGLLGRASEIAIETTLRPQTVSEYELLFVVQIVTTAIITAPFAYWMAGIVIGGVGPIESLKRSARIAARRWRLAILVACAGAAFGVIEIFALGAGLDLVSRLAAALGLDIDGSAGSGIATALVTLAGIVATSSLLVTVAALVAAPQVFVFVRMTGYAGGLDRAAATAGVGQPPGRLVTTPMRVLIGFVALAAVGGLLSLNGS